MLILIEFLIEGGFYNIVLIIYLYVVHVIICNPRNSASGGGFNLIIIIIIIKKNNSIFRQTRVSHTGCCHDSCINL
jgi:hypothetical protein